VSDVMQPATKILH